MERSTRTPATVGNSIRRADGRTPAATIRGRIKSRRREVPAVIASQVAKRIGSAAAAVDSVAAITPAAVDSADSAAADSEEAVVSEAVAGLAEASAAAAAAGADVAGAALAGA